MVDKKERVAKAREFFLKGYNCSQSVFCAFSDMYSIPEDLSLKLSASFGGGIGRMRETCGAACGMFMLAGLERGSATPGDAEGKKANYTLVQDLAEKFKQENGSLICAELLSGVRSQEQGTRTNNSTDPTPAPRTEEYYKKRPCVEMVASAVRIYLTTLHNPTQL